jgi:hypothetical protein
MVGCQRSSTSEIRDYFLVLGDILSEWIQSSRSGFELSIWHFQSSWFVVKLVK